MNTPRRSHRTARLGIAAMLALLIGVMALGCDLLDGDSPTEPRNPGPPPPGALNCPDTTYPEWQTSPLVLPYPVGQAYVVIQGNCTKGTHQGSARFAYDFDMPIGTTIVAARSGSVAAVRDDQENFNGTGEARFNLINIDHRDGTFATYLHLDKGGALVEFGDLVRQGDPIARSGASGLDADSPPHLHIAVKAAGDSLPTTFRNTTANPNGLIKGIIYPAEPYSPDDR